MRPVEAYLSNLANIRASGAGVAETSYYSPLEQLLTSVGATLTPKVHCVIHLRNAGAGIPDGGFFTPDQLRGHAGNDFPSPLPARGALEIKPMGDEVATVARSTQVARYIARYGQVLVTNYRDFLLVGRDTVGRPILLEPYRLADSEAAFWSAVALPGELAAAHEERLADYLRRMLMHAAPLETPADVAWVLASYAREARARIERAELPALASVRSALESSLGLTFQGTRGEHFFRSTLVQTLFYGIFSAWVLWSKKQPLSDGTAPFDWRLTPWEIHVPMIRALFEQIAVPSKLGPLGLVEVLNWTGAALGRVNRSAFFERFEENHAVQYFYEPFLEAFDPELRKQLGVWYTPPEIVQYMVSRVDTVLREELGIPAGLADRRVYVLDPCCGTGAYLVEVVKHIATKLEAGGGDALLANDLKHAMLSRVFGFEILPAPFVVAHLQLGLLLQNLGAPLSDDREERPSVYLTNALTGWEAAAGPRLRLPFPELEQERDAAERVKREAPILVVLGNPPYNGFSSVAIDEERGLTTAYRATTQAPAPEGQGLNDLYVRFFRMAERRIIEQTGEGVVCYISNYSWLDGRSFTGMRERYLEAFDRIWVDCLNGDKYKTGKLTPTGKPDPSIFSTALNPEGIQVGTAITLLVRTQNRTGTKTIQFRQMWGRNKRADLLASAVQGSDSRYEHLTPAMALGFPFLPTRLEVDYLSWPLLTDLLPTSFAGVKTSRDDVVVDIDRDRLIRRMRQYFDPAISHEQMRRIAPGAMESTARFDAERVRSHLLKRGFKPEYVVRYCYRPFDIRWLYWEPETKLLDEKRTESFPHVFDGNMWLEARQKQPKEAFDRGYVVRVLADNFGNGLSSFFPLYLAPSAQRSTLFEADAGNGPRTNLSLQAHRYLDRLAVTEEELFYHLVALLQSPAYRAENGGALRQDWPRLPLPESADLLRASSALGRQLAGLLDSESDIVGVLSPPIRPALRSIGAIARVGGGNLQAEDLALIVGWGHRGRGGVTMPGQGRIIARSYLPEELDAMNHGGMADGLSVDDVKSCLGSETYDVYLNDVAYWRNVPRCVWEYTIAGYQVIKKWLSYRERDLLGRSLTPNEARDVTGMARRIAAILLLRDRLDANYRLVKEAAMPWTVERAVALQAAGLPISAEHDGSDRPSLDTLMGR